MFYRTAQALFNPCTHEFTPSLPENLHGKPRKRERKRQHRRWSLYKRFSRNTEVHIANSFHVEKDGRFSKPAWMGQKASADVRQNITEALEKPSSNVAREMLSGITLIPYIGYVIPTFKFLL